MSYGGGYSTTSYGAQGGAGGGGFMAGGSQQDGGGKQGYGKDTLRPVTIKQLIEAVLPHPDADFSIDGAEVTQVTFVGQIRNISTQATNHTYRLDDGTGTIEVKQWIDPEAAENDAGSDPIRSKLVENAYARVWGRLKAFNNKRHVGAHVIRPVEDYNEVQYHLLESTAVHLHFTRGPLGAQTNGATNGDAHQDGYGQTNGHAAAGGAKPLPAGLNANARRVHECLRTSPQSNEGLHIQDIAVRLNMDMADVQRAGDDLQHNGLIYTTVDDHTWALLEEF